MLSEIKKITGRKTTKTATWYMFGNIFNSAISLVLLPIFTRLLSTSDYGIASTYLSWVNIASVLVGMQLAMTLRSAFSEHKDHLDQYISSILGLSSIPMIFVSAISVLVVSLWFKNISMQLVLMCLFQSYMSFIINVLIQKYMMTVQYIRRVLFMSLPNVIVALIGIVWVRQLTENKYMGRLWPYIIVYGAVGIATYIYCMCKGKTFFNRDYWKYAFAYAFPLVFHGLAVTVLAGMDKTMLTAMKNASVTGIYSVAYTLGMAITVISSALESVWIPWFTKQMTERKTDLINRAGRMYIWLGATLIVAAMMCLPEVLKLFAAPKYWSGASLIPPIVLASFFMFLYSISADLEYYYKATSQIAVNTIIAAGLNILLNWIFIPYYGAVAAAYTTVASYIVSFLIHYCVARKKDHELFSFKMYWVPIIFAISGTAVTYAALDYWYIRWPIAVALVIYGLVVIYKKDYKKITEEV